MCMYVSRYLYIQVVWTICQFLHIQSSEVHRGRRGPDSRISPFLYIHALATQQMTESRSLFHWARGMLPLRTHKDEDGESMVWPEKKKHQTFLTSKMLSVIWIANAIDYYFDQSDLSINETLWYNINEIFHTYTCTLADLSTCHQQCRWPSDHLGEPWEANTHTSLRIRTLQCHL